MYPGLHCAKLSTMHSYRSTTLNYARYHIPKYILDFRSVDKRECCIRDGVIMVAQLAGVSHHTIAELVYIYLLVFILNSLNFGC